MDLAESHGLFVNEDCAQAHGAKYKGRSVGSIGHVSAWSFAKTRSLQLVVKVEWSPPMITLSGHLCGHTKIMAKVGMPSIIRNIRRVSVLCMNHLVQIGV